MKRNQQKTLTGSTQCGLGKTLRVKWRDCLKEEGENLFYETWRSGRKIEMGLISSYAGTWWPFRSAILGALMVGISYSCSLEEHRAQMRSNSYHR